MAGPVGGERLGAAGAAGYRTITRIADWPDGHQVAFFHIEGDPDAAAGRLAAIAGFDPVVMAVRNPGGSPPARYLLLPAEQAARWRAAAGECETGDLAAITARLST